jgi:hypothetical protein
MNPGDPEGGLVGARIVEMLSSIYAPRAGAGPK